MPHGIFSLGAVLSLVWKPSYRLLPWAFTSAILTLAAMWGMCYWLYRRKIFLKI